MFKPSFLCLIKVAKKLISCRCRKPFIKPYKIISITKCSLIELTLGQALKSFYNCTTSFLKYTPSISSYSESAAVTAASSVSLCSVQAVTWSWESHKWPLFLIILHCTALHCTTLHPALNCTAICKINNLQTAKIQIEHFMLHTLIILSILHNDSSRNNPKSELYHILKIFVHELSSLNYSLSLTESRPMTFQDPNIIWANLINNNRRKGKAIIIQTKIT